MNETAIHLQCHVIKDLPETECITAIIEQEVRRKLVGQKVGC